MKQKKIRLAAIMICLCTALLTGCGNSQNNSTQNNVDTPKSSQTEADPT